MQEHGEVQSYGVLQDQPELHVWCLFLPFCVVK